MLENTLAQEHLPLPRVVLESASVLTNYHVARRLDCLFATSEKVIALFAGQGALYVNDVVNRFVFGRPTAAGATDIGDIIGGFYKRIVLMHVAILGGAFIAQMIGRTAPLILLVLLKTALELRFQIGRLRPQAAPASG